MSSYVVYMHTNKINNKKYIGATRLSVKERWRDGKGYKTQVFGRAIEKYGWENFTHEILFENLSKEEAETKEKELIAQYKTRESDYGYNIAVGGEGVGEKEDHPLFGTHKTEEQKEKQREKMLGDSNRMRGRKHTEEAKKKMREKAKQRESRPVSEETKKKISESKMGHEVSAEAREKIRKAKIGKPFIGEKTFTKKVICLETNIVFDSACEASRQTNIDRRMICRCCNDEASKAGGLHWQYYTPENVLKTIEEIEDDFYFRIHHKERTKNNEKLVC